MLLAFVRSRNRRTKMVRRLAIGVAVAALATGCFEGGFSPVRQGETVKIDRGGTLTALRWCGSVDCRGGLAGRAVIWVKACATKDGWKVAEDDFLAFVRSPDQAYYSDSIPRHEAFGHHTLHTGECAEGTLSFTLPERPQYLFFDDGIDRVRWKMAPHPAGGSGFHPIGPTGWNVALDRPPDGTAVPRKAAAALPCKRSGIRYIGKAPADTFVCFTLRGSQLVEFSYAFGADNQCPKSFVGRTRLSFDLDRPEVTARGRFHLDDASILLTGALHGANATGTFGDRTECGTKRFGWRARRTR